jgi:hypothetical protein
MKMFTVYFVLLRTGVAAGMVLVLTGCETPQDTAITGGLLSALAPFGKTPQSAASMAALGNATSGYANAQASRSQVVVQSGGSGSGSVGSPPTVYVLPAPTPAAEVDQSGVVNVVTEVENCDVIADGAFVGNTPAKLKLASGVHVIEIKKSGYKPYKREITVSKGSELSLRPTLEKE